jgi:hypothetical protein
MTRARGVEMATGACGVDCEVCRLRVMEVCSTCGPGRSPEAARKLEAQRRILGSPCPILACAALKDVDFCLRDCTEFPCVNFKAGPYPFSQGFLAMQERRRKEPPPALTHNRSPLMVPGEYWEKAAAREPSELATAGIIPGPHGGICLPSFNEMLWVDTLGRRLCRQEGGHSMELMDPLRELVTLLYLMNVQPASPGEGGLIGVGDLKEAHYFRGPHVLDLKGLVDRFGYDAKGFRHAATLLGGEAVDMADVGCRLVPYPRAPLTFLLHEGDEEFQPKMTVMFERSIEGIFSASGIWSLVKVATRALLQSPDPREETGWTAQDRFLAPAEGSGHS